MKPHYSIILALLVSACTTSIVTAQDAPNRPRGGGGFPRPLADTPRTGNPGASPKLTMADFKKLLEHWADFDSNKDALLAKSEVPELFAALFAQGDLNHDGMLDETERAKAGEIITAAQPVTRPPTSTK